MQINGKTILHGIMGNPVSHSLSPAMHNSAFAALNLNAAYLEEKTALPGKKVLILGAGGSARAIGFGLLEAGAELLLASRAAASGRELAQTLACPWHPLNEISELSADCLINATSVGMAPHTDVSLVPKECLSRFSVVMDIVYAPLETKLLREAREAGCQVVNGLAMLLYQGVAQFELWTRRKAPVEIMRQSLLAALAAK